ncbi:MAG: hypothetical protein QM489_04415 [Candidatus Izemoplasma sp.]
MEKLKKEFKNIVEMLGYYLYEITYQKEGNDFVLRVMIENDKYIKIDDCIIVSKKIEKFLDLDDPITDNYSLEVTSAGAEHELRNSAEISRGVGKFVYIETIEQKLSGNLTAYNGGILSLKQKNGKMTKINDIDVSFIRLAINL